MTDALPPCRDAGYIEDSVLGHPDVRCNWIICISGAGLAGLGRCSACGDWTDHDCPRFEPMQPEGAITRAVLGPGPMEAQP